MDLVQDFVDVVTSICARIYGKRSAKNRAKRMIEAANEDNQIDKMQP
jgi:putative resolvase